MADCSVHPPRPAALAAALALCAAAGGSVHAQDGVASAPSFHPGDSWLFDETVERDTSGFSDTRYALKVERVDSDSMVVGIKRDGSPTDFQDHVDGLDWSLRHLVDGREETTARPYNFPMAVGKTWTADYTDPQRHGLQTSAHYRWTYKVVGWEDVNVPAGTFHAMRVDATGTVQVQFAAATAAAAGAVVSNVGNTAVINSQASPSHAEYASLRSTFYYSPQIKATVKTVEEVYNSEDTRVRLTTRTLISTKPAS